MPLGVAKGGARGSRFDVMTSLVVLVGYAIPELRAGHLQIVLFYGGFSEWFPLRGLTSDNWEELAVARIPLLLAPDAAADLPGHQQLRRDHHADQRTPSSRRRASSTCWWYRAKGAVRRRCCTSTSSATLIPLVTGFPAAFVGAFFAGSVLIETLFSLDGLGLPSRVGGAARLSGGAGLAVSVHAIGLVIGWCRTCCTWRWTRACSSSEAVGK